MKYNVKIENKEYVIAVENISDEEQEIAEKNVSEKTDGCESLSAVDQCFSAAMAEYENEVARASKLDNKVYILLTVCAFIFTRITELIEKIPGVREIEENKTRVSSLCQAHYATAVGFVTGLFSITLILLVVLLSNIKMNRLDTSIILGKNLLELPQKTVVKFLCVKYTQATDKNRENLKRRYILFNWCILFLILTIVSVIAVTYAGTYVTFNKK